MVVENLEYGEYFSGPKLVQSLCSSCKSIVIPENCAKLLSSGTGTSTLLGIPGLTSVLVLVL